MHYTYTFQSVNHNEGNYSIKAIILFQMRVCSPIYMQHINVLNKHTVHSTESSTKKCMNTFAQTSLAFKTTVFWHKHLKHVTIKTAWLSMLDTKCTKLSEKTNLLPQMKWFLVTETKRMKKKRLSLTDSLETHHRPLHT